MIFENVEFGKIRIVNLRGKVYAFGVDVAKKLGYARPSKAISDNCKGVQIEDAIKNAGRYPE